MTLTDEDIQKIEANYNKFLALCSKLSEENGRRSAVINLTEHFGNRLGICPASVHIDYHNAFHGGLIDHSLRVLANANKIAKATNVAVDTESLILVCLFHDIGKLGSLDEELMIEQMGSYQRDRGWRFEYNTKIQFMSVPHRSLYLLQHFGVKLTEEEFLAILLSSETNNNSEEFVHYNLKEPSLAMLVKMADQLSCAQESGRV